MTEFLGNDRFTVVRLLGTGGYGNVYEVLDRVHGQHKALKALHTLDPHGVFRLKSEFRALVDLSHPNLVHLEELFAEGDAWFMTLELIHGVPFLEGIHEEGPPGAAPAGAGPAFEGYATLRPGETSTMAPSRPLAARRFDEELLRSALRQLVDGLNYLHRAGLCHRDLKPSNVLLEKNGRLVLVDFGLSQSLFAPTSAHSVEGTPVYMSPEQLSGESVGPASDWYSVGVMLYEALTGVLPYDGSDFYIAMQKKGERPRSPHQLVSDLPYDLVQLCIELLSPNPADRPTGTQLQRRVARRQTPRVLPAVQEDLAFPIEPRADAANLAVSVGVGEVRRGQSRCVVLVGGANSGKTETLRRLSERARELDPEATVLATRCRKGESLRFRSIDPLVDATVERLAGLGDAVRLDWPALALAEATFPVIGRLAPADHAERVAATRASDRNAASGEPGLVDLGPLASSLASLFSSLATRSTLVLALDDLSLGDAPGAELLGRVLGLIAPAALLLVTVNRDADRAPWDALEASMPSVRTRRVEVVRTE